MYPGKQTCNNDGHHSGDLFVFNDSGKSGLEAALVGSLQDSEGKAVAVRSKKTLNVALFMNDSRPDGAPNRR